MDRTPEHYDDHDDPARLLLSGLYSAIERERRQWKACRRPLAAVGSSATAILEDPLLKQNEHELLRHDEVMSNLGAMVDTVYSELQALAAKALANPAPPTDHGRLPRSLLLALRALPATYQLLGDLQSLVAPRAQFSEILEAVIRNNERPVASERLLHEWTTFAGNDKVAAVFRAFPLLHSAALTMNGDALQASPEAAPAAAPPRWPRKLLFGTVAAAAGAIAVGACVAFALKPRSSIQAAISGTLQRLSATEADRRLFEELAAKATSSAGESGQQRLSEILGVVTQHGDFLSSYDLNHRKEDLKRLLAYQTKALREATVKAGVLLAGLVAGVSATTKGAAAVVSRALLRLESVYGAVCLPELEALCLPAAANNNNPKPGPSTPSPRFFSSWSGGASPSVNSAATSPRSVSAPSRPEDSEEDSQDSAEAPTFASSPSASSPSSPSTLHHLGPGELDCLTDHLEGKVRTTLDRACLAAAEYLGFLRHILSAHIDRAGDGADNSEVGPKPPSQATLKHCEQLLDTVNAALAKAGFSTQPLTQPTKGTMEAEREGDTRVERWRRFISSSSSPRSLSFALTQSRLPSWLLAATACCVCQQPFSPASASVVGAFKIKQKRRQSRRRGESVLASLLRDAEDEESAAPCVTVKPLGACSLQHPMCRDCLQGYLRVNHGRLSRHFALQNFPGGDEEEQGWASALFHPGRALSVATGSTPRPLSVFQLASFAGLNATRHGDSGSSNGSSNGRRSRCPFRHYRRQRRQQQALATISLDGRYRHPSDPVEVVKALLLGKSSSYSSPLDLVATRCPVCRESEGCDSERDDARDNDDGTGSEAEEDARVFGRRLQTGAGDNGGNGKYITRLMALSSPFLAGQ